MLRKGWCIKTPAVIRNYARREIEVLVTVTHSGIPGNGVSLRFQEEGDGFKLTFTDAQALAELQKMLRRALGT